MAVEIEEIIDKKGSHSSKFRVKKQRLMKYESSLLEEPESSVISQKENPIPIHVRYEGDLVHVEYASTGENQTSNRILKSIERIHSEFSTVAEEALPSFVDVIQSLRESNGKGFVTMTISQFRAIQVFNYAFHLMSFTSDINLQESIPQYPFLIRMYNGLGDALENQRLECFARIIREWVIHSVKYSLNVQVSKSKSSSIISRDQMTLVKALHSLLNTFLCFHHGDTSAFIKFISNDSIGMCIIYNFLFVSSVDKIHWRAIEELDEFFRVSPDKRPDTRTRDVYSRHYDLVNSIPQLRNLKCDSDGFIAIDSVIEKYNINPVSLKMQFYAIACDPFMDSTVSMAILCALTSTTINPIQRRRMVAFGSGLSTPFQQSFKSQETRQKLQQIYTDVLFSFDEKEILTLKDNLAPSKAYGDTVIDDKDELLSLLQEGSSSMKHHDVLNPLEYLEMLKQTPTERNVLFSPSTRVNPMEMIGLSYFLMELDRRIVTKAKVSPLIFFWKEYSNPKIQFPLSLTSERSCIYMDEIYFD
jgi:hypothetical protein